MAGGGGRGSVKRVPVPQEPCPAEEGRGGASRPQCPPGPPPRQAPGMRGIRLRRGRAGFPRARAASPHSQDARWRPRSHRPAAEGGGVSAARGGPGPRPPRQLGDSGPKRASAGAGRKGSPGCEKQRRSMPSRRFLKSRRPEDAVLNSVLEVGALGTRWRKCLVEGGKTNGGVGLESPPPQSGPRFPSRDTVALRGSS